MSKQGNGAGFRDGLSGPYTAWADVGERVSVVYYGARVEGVLTGFRSSWSAMAIGAERSVRVTAGAWCSAIGREIEAGETLVIGENEGGGLEVLA